MEKLKVSEIFYSVQGEGRYMGVPSVFLRTFGCNFKCAGFGMPKDQNTKELDPIVANIDFYKDYKELPLVSTGCDSYASWHPAFKHLSPFYSIDEVVEKIIGTLPFGEWMDEHLVITGGEPLLKWQYLYPELLSHPKMKNLKEITFETNGTQMLTEEFYNYLRMWQFDNDHKCREVTFSVSAKLSCSGETREAAIKPDVLNQYQEVGHAYLKLVIADESDAEEALETIDIFKANGFTGNSYLMPIGGVESVYSMNNRKVAEFAMKNGLRYSDRLQVPLFRNAWGT